MSTGWFGIPGKVPSKSTKVHAFHEGRTLCGWTPDPKYQFQWCATGIVLTLIDCSRCRAKIEEPLNLVEKYGKTLLFPNSKVSLFHTTLGGRNRQ